MTKVHTFCWWCQAPVKMPEGFNEKKHKPICSVGCRDAETLFNMYFSDEEIYRRYDEEPARGGENDRRLGT